MLDNQEAEIIVGQNVPIVTGQSTSASSTTENPFTTVERQDIGISLKVKPQINEGDAITMEIEQEVSSIAASSEGTVDIVTNKRAIKTTVQLEDGELLVLGGLIDDALTESEQKINDELLAVQGEPADIGGYYQPDDAKASTVMRPSGTFNSILATL